MTVLKLDIDHECTLSVICAILNEIKYKAGILGLKVKDIVIRPSTNNRIHVWLHVDVQLPTYGFQIYLQLAFGDDEKRVRYNFKRWRVLNEEASKLDILFARKRTIKLK